MYDLERGWSLSFAGCGFMGFYHVGATRCLSEHAPHLLRDARMFLGCSAGALHCASFLCGMPLDKTLQILMDLVRQARSRSIGALHPSFNMDRCLRKDLQQHLPPNAHQLVSGKLCISLTRVSDGENVLVSDFHSKQEVVDALLCSCFIPFYSGLIPPCFRGERYMDGGASDNVPCLDARTTITVSPFYGEHDICPKIKSTNFLHVNITNLSLRLCLGNVYLLTRALFPPDVKVLGEICLRGYLDALRFLEEKGIYNRPQPCLALPSEEPGPEVHSEESYSEPAAWALGPDGKELLDHLRLSILPWDDSILRALSPRLTAVLSETMKDRGGYVNKLFNFLPIRILSYMVLPCTLPVESTFAAVKRLVRWLPDLPADIQWLQWLSSQMVARLSTCLFAASRSNQRQVNGPRTSRRSPEHGSAGLQPAGPLFPCGPRRPAGPAQRPCSRA